EAAAWSRRLRSPSPKEGMPQVHSTGVPSEVPLQRLWREAATRSADALKSMVFKLIGERRGGLPGWEPRLKGRGRCDAPYSSVAPAGAWDLGWRGVPGASRLR